MSLFIYPDGQVILELSDDHTLNINPHKRSTSIADILTTIALEPMDYSREMLEHICGQPITEPIEFILFNGSGSGIFLIKAIG